MTKSRTIMFSALLAALSVLELNMHILQRYLSPDHFGAVTLAVAIIVAVLRAATTEPLGDRK